MIKPVLLFFVTSIILYFVFISFLQNLAYFRVGCRQGGLVKIKLICVTNLEIYAFLILILIIG